MIFYHKFEVRWSDLDANKHLANSSYVQYCAQTRMAFMKQEKMGVTQMSRWGIGPVIMHERFSFFKEIFADQTVIVSLEVDACADDCSIYRFVHKFYTPEGEHCATSEATGVWIDTMLRKMTTPPDDVIEAISKYKSPDTVVLTREDFKKLPFRPENINPSELA